MQLGIQLVKLTIVSVFLKNPLSQLEQDGGYVGSPVNEMHEVQPLGHF